MDSFICGTCGKIFYALQEFTEHKLIHNLLLTARSSNLVQDESAAEECISSTSTSKFVVVSNAGNCPSFSKSVPNGVYTNQSNSYDSQHTGARLPSTLDPAVGVASLGIISQSSSDKVHQISPEDVRWNFKESRKSSSALSVFPSRRASCSIASGGNAAPNEKSGCNTANSKYTLSFNISKTQDVSKRFHHQVLKENSTLEPDRHLCQSEVDCLKDALGKDIRNTIQIFETENDAFIMGSDSVEESLMDVVHIEISDNPGNEEAVMGSSELSECKVNFSPKVDLNCTKDASESGSTEKGVTVGGGADVDDESGGKKEIGQSSSMNGMLMGSLEQLISLSRVVVTDDDDELLKDIHPPVKSDHDDSFVDRSSSKLSYKVRIKGIDPLHPNRTPFENKENETENDAQDEDFQDLQNDVIGNSSNGCHLAQRMDFHLDELPDTEGETSHGKDNQEITSQINQNESDQKISCKINQNETDNERENGAALPLTGTDAGPLVSVEGMDLINSSLVSSSSEVTDATYASAPGLYTLLLNADNTFTLVAGGYEGTSNGQSNRIYVCHHCKKFALSQVEILNHISVCHPEDLEDVNRCVAEFSSLTNSGCESNIPEEDPNQVLFSKVNVTGPGDKSLLEINTNHASHSSSVSVVIPQPARSVRKKLGRPRKEDQIKDETLTSGSLQVRSFIKEGSGFVCLNCQKYFPKHRQFDKHKCSMWKDSLHPPDGSQDSYGLSDAGGEGGRLIGENYSPSDDLVDDLSFSFTEDDLQEEWKANKRYKPKVKIKAKDVQRRKRGRPPKVDIVMPTAMTCEAPQGSENETKFSDVTTTTVNQTISVEPPLPGMLPFVGGGGTIVPSESSYGSNPPPRLNAIPTLPVFSNAQQQERLHKWIAQIDLSFVDTIIDKCRGGGNVSYRGAEMYACKECKVMFRSLLACRRHCAKHMSHKAFTCPDCDFATTNVGALYSHYRNHTQNLYACNKCDFRARIKAHFRDHLETHNPNRYVCCLCQRPYSTSNSLRSHIYHYHSNKEGMKYLWFLRKKNQDRDTKNAYFQCPICSKLFGERSSANRHIASHGPSVPEIFIKCEVCSVETLNPDTLKKHMQKHKVVYICSECRNPQVTASSLRSHQKSGQCLAPQPETFKQSLLLSFTSPESFPSLLSNKRIGPLLQQKMMDSFCVESEEGNACKVSDALLKQMQEFGYKQIYKLLQEEKGGEVPEAKIERGNAIEQTVGDIMKIVVDTRNADDNEQYVSWEHQQLQPQERHIEGKEEPLEAQQCYQDTSSEAQTCDYMERVDVVPYGTEISSSKVSTSPLYLTPDPDPNSGESDQRVVVISNVGEEQTVVVEDGQMMIMEEERFVVINEDCSGGKEPIYFAKLFVDNG